MASDVHFLSRNAVFEDERKVTLTKEGVIRVVGTKGETRFPVHEIGLIELSAESSFATGVVYVCQIYKKRAWFPALTLKSKGYRGPNDFDDRRSGYRALMMALHAQIVANAWPVKTQISARPAALMFGLLGYAHWAILIWGAAFLASVMVIAAFDRSWAIYVPEASLVVASVVALAYLGSKVSGIRAAYGPWVYDARSIPQSALPEPFGSE